MMKKIFLLAFIMMLGKIGFSQFPVTQYIGSDSANVISKGGLQGRLINTVYADTGAANNSRIRQYPGAQIVTNGAGMKIWLRNQDATRWLQIPAGSGVGNIYTIDGTLTGNRELDGDGYGLNFEAVRRFSIGGDTVFFNVPYQEYKTGMQQFMLSDTLAKLVRSGKATLLVESVNGAARIVLNPEGPADERKYEINADDEEFWIAQLKDDESSADTLFFISAAGNVGIGTSSPTQKLEVKGNAYINGQLSAGDTSLTNTYFIQGTAFAPMVLGRKAINSPTQSTDPRIAGVIGHVVVRDSISNRAVGGSFNVTTDSANTKSGQFLTGQLRASQSWVTHNGTGTIPQSWGSYNVITNNTTGSLVNAYGSVSGVENRSTGSISKLHGQSVEVWNNNGGSIDTVFGQTISIYNNNPASTINTAYGLSIGKGMISQSGGTHYWRNGGTINNSFGLYIDTSVDVGINKYALYSFSRSNSYFNGNVGLGTETPGGRLAIVDTGGFALKINYNSASTDANNNAALYAENNGLTSYVAILNEKTTNNTGGQYPLLVESSLLSGTAQNGMATGIHFGVPDDAGNKKVTQLALRTTNAAAATYSNRAELRLWNNGSISTPYYLLGNGNMGLGTATPDSNLTVVNGAYFQRGVRMSGLPQASGTKALRIDASGNISTSDTLIDAGGTVTSIATNNGSGITGGTITTSGTLAIDTLLISTRAWRQKGVDSVAALVGSGYVPYVGATQNLNLGQNGLLTEFATFDTTSRAVTARTLQWSNDNGTLQFGMTNGGTLTQNIGLQQFARVKNVQGTQINKGQAVYIYGASGDRASVKLAYNKADSNSSKTLGVAAEDIPANDVGLVGTFGTISNLNLSTFAPGDILYLDSIPGGLTATKPQAPYHIVFIGVVERANSGNGLLFVNPQNGYELDELHNVKITSPVNNKAILVYDSVRALWVDTTLGAIGGVTGSGTTNYIPKFTATGTIGNSQIFDNGTAVGINTITPESGYQLDVNGNIKAKNEITIKGRDSDGIGHLYFNSNTGTFSYLNIVPSSNEFRFNIIPSAGLYRFMVNNTNRLLVNSSGVGVGTTSIDSILTVSGGANFSSGVRMSGLPSAPGTKALRINANGTLSVADTLIDAGGTVTSVATNTGTGITGGTITTSGTLAIDTLLISTRAWRQKGIDSIVSKFVPYTGATTNVNLGTNTLTANGISSSNQVNITGGAAITLGLQALQLPTGTESTMSAGLSVRTGVSGESIIQFGNNLNTYYTGTTNSAKPGAMIRLDTRGAAPIPGSAAYSVFQIQTRAAGTADPNYTVPVQIAAAPSGSFVLDGSGYGYFYNRLRVGNTTSSPTEALDVTGNGKFSGTVTASNGTLVGGTGTTNYIPKFTSSSAIGNSQIFDNGTNVGIGTITPATKLDVSSSAADVMRLRGTNGGTTNNTQLRFYGSNAATDLWAIGTEVSTGSTGRAFDFYDLVAGANRMRLDASGNLGLGVTPSAWTTYPALQIARAGFMGAGNDNNISTNGYYDGSWKYIATAAAGLYNISGNVHSWYTAPSGTAGNAITWTQAMTLDASGRLGIGTTSPAYKLVVSNAGALGLEIDPTSSSGGILTLLSYDRNVGGYKPLQINAEDIRFQTGAVSTERMRITSGGNVGIGTTSANGKLTVKEGVTSFEINTGTSVSQLLSYDRVNSSYQELQLRGSYFTFAPNDNEGMRLTSTGLGIGTTSPSEKLEVNGNIKTAAPSGGSAQPWKLGSKVSASVTLVTTDYIEVEIGGVAYKLALVN